MYVAAAGAARPGHQRAELPRQLLVPRLVCQGGRSGRVIRRDSRCHQHAARRCRGARGQSPEPDQFPAEVVQAGAHPGRGLHLEPHHLLLHPRLAVEHLRQDRAGKDGGASGRVQEHEFLLHAQRDPARRTSHPGRAAEHREARSGAAGPGRRRPSRRPGCRWPHRASDAGIAEGSRRSHSSGSGPPRGPNDAYYSLHSLDLAIIRWRRLDSGGPGCAAQTRWLTSQRLIKLTLARAVKDSGNLGEQVGPIPCELGQRGHRAWPDGDSDAGGSDGYCHRHPITTKGDSHRLAEAPSPARGDPLATQPRPAGRTAGHQPGKPAGGHAP